MNIGVSGIIFRILKEGKLPLGPNLVASNSHKELPCAHWPIIFSFSWSEIVYMQEGKLELFITIILLINY